MVSQTMQAMLPKIQGYFKGQPVEKAWLFGSSSRGEERPDSDVDIIVRYEKGARITLFKIAKIMIDMEHLLGKEVDLVEEDALLPFAKETADKDKILIYEREN